MNDKEIKTQGSFWVVSWVKGEIDGLKIPGINAYDSEEKALKKVSQLTKRGIAATIKKI